MSINPSPDIDTTDTWIVLNNVFEGVDNTLTQEQYLELFKASKISVPEVRLWIAVLESVIIDWTEHKTHPTKITERHVAEIKSWIYDDGPIMSLIGDAIFLVLRFPYENFKKKLHSWLAKNEAIPNINMDVGTLFDEVPTSEVNIGGNFNGHVI